MAQADQQTIPLRVAEQDARIEDVHVALRGDEADDEVSDVRIVVAIEEDPRADQHKSEIQGDGYEREREKILPEKAHYVSRDRSQPVGQDLGHELDELVESDVRAKDEAHKDNDHCQDQVAEK